MLKKHVTCYSSPVEAYINVSMLTVAVYPGSKRNNLSFCQTCVNPRQSRLSWHGMIQSSALRSVKKAKTDIMAGAASKYSTKHNVCAKFSL